MDIPLVSGRVGGDSDDVVDEDIEDVATNEDEYWSVGCATCKQQVAISHMKNPSTASLYCSILCMGEGSAVGDPEKHDQWDALLASGYRLVDVAKAYGAHRVVIRRSVDRLRRPLPERYPWLQPPMTP